MKKYLYLPLIATFLLSGCGGAESISSSIISSSSSSASKIDNWTKEQRFEHFDDSLNKAISKFASVENFGIEASVAKVDSEAEVYEAIYDSEEGYSCSKVSEESVLITDLEIDSAASGLVETSKDKLVSSAHMSMGSIEASYSDLSDVTSLSVRDQSFDAYLSNGNLYVDATNGADLIETIIMLIKGESLSYPEKFYGDFEELTGQSLITPFAPMMSFYMAMIKGELEASDVDLGDLLDVNVYQDGSSELILNITSPSQLIGLVSSEDVAMLDYLTTLEFSFSFAISKDIEFSNITLELNTSMSDAAVLAYLEAYHQAIETQVEEGVLDNLSSDIAFPRKAEFSLDLDFDYEAMPSLPSDLGGEGWTLLEQK